MKTRNTLSVHKSARRRRAEAALWRAAKAEGLARSKTWRNWIAALAVLAAPLSVQAQSLAIDWFTLDGGGGMSTGGVFAVSGTIGQSDAQAPPLQGGPFSLVGGFWSILVVPTPGAPRLTITRNPQLSAVIVSWPSASPGFALQQNADLNTTNWTAPPQLVNDNGTNKFILISPPAGNRFYRLFKP